MPGRGPSSNCPKEKNRPSILLSTRANMKRDDVRDVPGRKSVWLGVVFEMCSYPPPNPRADDYRFCSLRNLNAFFSVTRFEHALVVTTLTTYDYRPVGTVRGSWCRLRPLPALPGEKIPVPYLRDTSFVFDKSPGIIAARLFFPYRRRNEILQGNYYPAAVIRQLYIYMVRNYGAYLRRRRRSVTRS